MTGFNFDENTCPNCGIAVYQAEALLAGNYRWHKRCFKCCLCNKFLNTSNCNVHQGFLFCRHCLNEVTKSDAPQIYPDTTVIKASNGYGGDGLEHDGVGPRPRQSPCSGCPRCGGSVFEAEKVMEKGRTYHKRCFKCFKCNRPQDDKLQVFIGFDDQVYCKVCYPKIWHTPLPLDPSQTSKIMADAGDICGCPRCGGKVFEAEKMSVGHGMYHKRCFSCRICQRPMDYYNSVSHEREIFCKSCFRTYFDMRSKSVGPPDTSVIRGGSGDRDTCPRCGGTVFEAEKIGARSHDYHVKCLSCHGCHHKLDASSFFDAPDGEVYCYGCYSISYGHKSRAKSMGPSDTRRIPGVLGDVARCPHCSGKVFEAEKLVSRNGWYHQSCCKCFRCQHQLDQTNFNDGPDGNIYCATCYKNLGMMSQNMTAKSMTETDTIRGQSDGDACPRCAGKVFEAEKMVARWGVYHKKCFTCINCNSALDALKAVDGPGGHVFCQPCYSKNYGPSELRVLNADESLKSQDTTVIKPVNRTPGCPRCGGAVFEAEKVMSKGYAFHTKCNTCRNCNKKLDAGSLCAGFGSDPEIYCKGCYFRQTGGSGYRGIQGGQWIDEKTSASLRPTQYINPASIKASMGEVSCRKCQGKVYELERIVSKTGVFHKQCFSCQGCHANLDSTLVYNYEAPDGGVYCKRCFVGRFGEGVKPLSYTNTAAITAVDGKGCPRCGGAVFEAEKFPALDRSYHISCATCRACNHKLEASSLCCGSDKDIYCEGCYSRKFGGAGYRGSQGNKWVDESANILLRPCQNVDPSRIRVEEGNPDACKKCQGKVFDLERITSKSGVWHKQCFVCNGCRSTLTSTLVYGFEAPDNEIYCKTCFVKSFGEGTKTLQFSDTRVLKPSGPGEHGCPRCKGVVFEAEKIVAGENVWFHKTCFDCQICHTKLDSVRSAIGVNGDAFCQSCYKAQLEAERAQANVAKTQNVIAAEPGDPMACPRCNGKVFEAEKMSSRERYFHRRCFTCLTCSHALDYSNCMEGPNCEIYCKTCYVRAYFTGGRNKFGDARSLPSSANDRDGCPKCHKLVFEVDKVSARCGQFHKQCLWCGTCQRQLDASNFYESSQDIYCSKCYSDEFGVCGKAVSGSGRVDTSRLMADQDDDESRCPRCKGKVFEAEKMKTSAGPYHPACFKCAKCAANLDQSNCYCGYDREIYCQLCYKEEYGVLSRRGRSRSSRPASRGTSRNRGSYYEDLDSTTDGVEDALAKAVVDTTAIIAMEGEKDACPRCKGKVFEAEKMSSTHGVYHKKCFTCLDCHRALDSSLVCDSGPATSATTLGHRPEIFCSNCYTKRYGPTVRTFDESAALKSLDLSRSKPLDPSKACGRCGGAVFAQEELQAGTGRTYHKACAKCRGCQKQLEANQIYCGEDKDIYCQGCYSRTFGQAGFRGAQTAPAHWADAGSACLLSNRAKGQDISATTGLIKADEGDAANACIRCMGKVFSAERIISSHGVFHKTCYKCAAPDCQISLDSTKACDAPNREIYCRNCYGKYFGLHGYGYGGFGSIPALTAGGKDIKVQEYHFTQFF